MLHIDLCQHSKHDKHVLIKNNNNNNDCFSPPCRTQLTQIQYYVMHPPDTRPPEALRPTWLRAHRRCRSWQWWRCQSTDARVLIAAGKINTTAHGRRILDQFIELNVINDVWSFRVDDNGEYLYSLSPGRSRYNFKDAVFDLDLLIGIFGYS